MLKDTAHAITAPAGRRAYALALLLCVVTALAMQAHSGAWNADLASDPDEPAHAVSALMVHDYLRQGLPGKPVPFAQRFADHYPKVAIGHWPPLFYAAEGGWMLVAGRSRTAMLVFVALCGAALLWSVFALVLRRSTLFVACLATGLLAISPLFGHVLYMARPDLLLALLVLWAAAFAGDFVFAGRPRDGWMAVALMLAAALVHGRGLVLLLLPVCLMPLRPKGRRIGGAWVAVAAVCVLGTLVPRVMAPPEAIQWGFPWDYLLSIVRGVGWLPLLLLALGWWKRRAGLDSLSASMIALLVGDLLFHALVPGNWDDLYLITVLPAFAVLAGVASEWLTERRGWWRQTPVAWGVLGVLLAWAVVAEPKKPSSGFREAVAGGMLTGHAGSLVAGVPMMEGGLIAEAALADPQLHSTVYRGSKLLSSSSWNGRGYHLLRGSPQEVLRLLDAKGVSLVVVQSEGGAPAVWQLREALREGAAKWRPVAIGVKDVSAYERVAQEASPSEGATDAAGSGLERSRKATVPSTNDRPATQR